MLLLGCIADDFTGATDLANNLVRAGMRVVQTIGVPGAEDGPPPADAQAVVIALKSRTVPAAEAVAHSLQALAWLRAHGAAQIYFKVCSTFDSTDHGNIGPVAEALADALQAPVVPVCPAFPEAGRTVFKGHLFVGDLLLSDSPMRHHPLTPMTDAHLVRVLQRQSRGAVGGVTHDVLRQGPATVRQRLDALAAAGTRLAVVDAIDNADLLTLGQAAVGLPLLVAGSGVAIGLPPTHGLAPSAQAAALPATPGPRAIVSGSCSAATNAQVAHFLAQGGAGYQINPMALAEGRRPAELAAAALAWAEPVLAAGATPLVYATAAPQAVQAAQARLGVHEAGAQVEATLAAVAAGLVARGVRQLVVAGGETSGACVQALQVSQLRIGAQIDPGVPWCHTPSPVAGGAGLRIALKSGNFGGEDFFTRAFVRAAEADAALANLAPDAAA